MLLPRNKYGPKEKELTDKFFKNGGYNFLIDLEFNFEDCGSICNKPLFYITRDISKGLPKKDCLEAAIETADEKVKEAVYRLEITYYIVIVSSGIPIFLLCGYNKSLDRLEKEALEEEEKLKQKEEEADQNKVDVEEQKETNNSQSQKQKPIHINIMQLASPGKLVE